MAAILSGLLGGLLGGSAAGDTGMNTPKSGEDAVTRQVVEHYENSNELSSQMAPNGISNVISQDERIQLISPNQMIHTDFVVNPDIGSISRLSTQLQMNLISNSTNEFVFEFSSNQTSVFLKDIRLEMEVFIEEEGISGRGCFPVTKIIGGQYWWTQFFNQMRVEINGGQAVVTDIAALRAIMLAMETLNPNDGIDVGAIRRHIDTATVNGGDYWEDIDLERKNPSTVANPREKIDYVQTSFFKTVYLPLTFFDIKELLAPNSIVKITFLRNPVPVALLATSGSGTANAVDLGDGGINKDVRLWKVSAKNVSLWLTSFECNPAKMRADAMAHTLQGVPNQIVWYLPQHQNFVMRGGTFKDWGTYHVPNGGPYASYTEDIQIQGTGVAPNQYVIVPEVTWDIWVALGADYVLTDTKQTWTEAVPGLVTLEEVSINSQVMNNVSSVLPNNLATGLAQGSFEAFMRLAKYRARAATTERFSQKQLNAGTWKRLMQRIESQNTCHLGNAGGANLALAENINQVAEGVFVNHVSEVFAQIPWEKLRQMPYTIVPTVLNEDPYVIVTPQRGTIRLTLRIMQNFFLFAENPVPGCAVVTDDVKIQDSPDVNFPYLPYQGERIFVGYIANLPPQPPPQVTGKIRRLIVLKNPKLNIRVVSLNITMTEYGEANMIVQNTNLFEKIGAVGGI